MQVQIRQVQVMQVQIRQVQVTHAQIIQVQIRQAPGQRYTHGNIAGRAPEQRYTQSNIAGRFRKGDPLLESGLLGPVILSREKRSTRKTRDTIFVWKDGALV